MRVTGATEEQALRVAGLKPRGHVLPMGPTERDDRDDGAAVTAHSATQRGEWEGDTAGSSGGGGGARSGGAAADAALEAAALEAAEEAARRRLEDLLRFHASRRGGRPAAAWRFKRARAGPLGSRRGRRATHRRNWLSRERALLELAARELQHVRRPPPFAA